MDMYKQKLMDLLKASVEAFADLDLEKLIAQPSDSSKGDYALPCFALAKTLRKSPVAIAEEIASSLELPELFSKVEAVSGYLNFFVDTTSIIKSVLSEVDSKKNAFGDLPSNGKTVVIDYSSPNIGKQLAFHHLRSTGIGNSLYRIYKAAGWNAVGINHLGDWGTQFGKLIVMYLREGYATDEETLSSIPLQRLNELYVSFGNASKEDDSLEDQAREAFAKMEAGDELHLKLWGAFKKTTLKELQSLYDLMGIHFDSYTGEAFFNDHLDDTLAFLEEHKLLAQSQERDVVLLDEEEMPPCLIRKSDGSTLYATRDLAAARYRKKTYDFDRCLYVVDNGQSLHFKQVFTVLKKAEQDWSENLMHIPFGLILQKNPETNKWSKGSSKQGNSNTLREVFEAASAKILEAINEKNPDLEDKESVAMQIGISALLFNDLKNKRLMDVKFDWDQALSFDGDTGPYVQNAHVRLCSIMRKAKRTVAIKDVKWVHLQDESAVELVKLLSLVSQKVQQATEINEAYVLCQLALDIAGAAHRFIHNCRVLGSEEETSRLFLVQCTQIVLEKVISLIGMNPIQKM